jgi:hypothetical protein
VSEADLTPCNVWTLAAVFSTVTNVNDERLADYIGELMLLKQFAQAVEKRQVQLLL